MQGKDLTHSDGAGGQGRGSIQKNIPPSGIEIRPVSFRQPERGRGAPSWRWLLGLLLLVFFCVLAVAVWFVFTARQVVVRIEPEPDGVSVSGGFFTPRIGPYYLMRPGEYTLEAVKECYRPLRKGLRVTDEQSQTRSFKMEKLPGRLSVAVHDAENPDLLIQGAGVRLGDREVGKTPFAPIEVKAGKRRLRITAEHYQDLETDVDIEGCGRDQSVNLALVPGWADVELRSIPQNADVLVDAKPSGRTPVVLKLQPGSHRLEIRAEKHKAWRKQVMVEANQDQAIGPIRLAPADGMLHLRTNPSGANVTVEKVFLGRTPLKIPLIPDTPHEIRITKGGYEKAVREVTLSSGEKREVGVDLVPVKGIVHFKVDPPDAELLINGKPRGKVPEDLQLVAVPHRIVIQRDGYQPFETTITPRPGFPQELKVILKGRSESPKTAESSVIKAANGYALKRIQPGAFVMGSSRREQGRRSNETIRKVSLKRPFYMGIREVTNREFREFQPGHASGTVARYSLNRDELPVVSVTWEQAALFCNWLSEKEGLPPSYIRQGDRLVAAEPLNRGYRLPTEAEWEYCARYDSGGFVKYPWGDNYPPKTKSGNYADVSDKDLLPNYLPNYSDGFPVTAPPGSFAPNVLGLYDLGGNVAEWCHDLYSIYSYAPGKIYTDPTGPVKGNHHVIKGAGWKDSSISDLRLSYRDYSNSSRSDLGFRVSRYADGVSE